MRETQTDHRPPRKVLPTRRLGVRSAVGCTVARARSVGLGLRRRRCRCVRNTVAGQHSGGHADHVDLDPHGASDEHDDDPARRVVTDDEPFGGHDAKHVPGNVSAGDRGAGRAG